MLPEGKKYHAFISYSRVDKAYVNFIVDSIQQMGLSYSQRFSRDINLFVDTEQIAVHGTLKEAIKYGIENSQYLILILSKNSLVSKTILKKEIKPWFNNHKNNDGSINNFKIIRIDDNVSWQDLNREFKNKLFKGAPVWCELVAYCGEGRVLRTLEGYDELIAGIKGPLIGKSITEILQKDQRRRSYAQRIRNAAIILLLVMVSVLIYLSFSASQERDKAISSEKKAIEILNKFSKEVFDRHLKDVISYLYGDEPCFALGSLIAADSIIDDNLRNKDISDSEKIHVKKLIDSIHKLSLPCEK